MSKSVPGDAARDVPADAAKAGPGNAAPHHDTRGYGFELPLLLFGGFRSIIDELHAELARRGWTEADLKKLAGDNVLRALTQAETVAKRLQKERPPSTATIQQLDAKVAQ